VLPWVAANAVTLGSAGRPHGADQIPHAAVPSSSTTARLRTTVLPATRVNFPGNRSRCLSSAPAIWRNDTIRQPVLRSLVAWDHRPWNWSL